MHKQYKFHELSLFGILLIVVILSRQVVFNPTTSVARGYYFTYPVLNYTVNDLVLLCVNNQVQLSIMHQLHLPYTTNACLNNAPFLMKYIVASANDVVEVTPSGILVNGRFQENSKGIKQYKNISLPTMPLGKFKLAPDEFFVLGKSSHSYDSRYFGIIKKTQIVAKARLLFLRERLIW